MPYLWTSFSDCKLLLPYCDTESVESREDNWSNGIRGLFGAVIASVIGYYYRVAQESGSKFIPQNVAIVHLDTTSTQSLATSLTLPAILVHLSLRKTPTFRDAITGFPVRWRLRNHYRNSILYDDMSLPRSSDWLKICFIQSGSLPRTMWRRVISIEFLRSFPRRYSLWKPVVGSRNVRCRLSSFLISLIERKKCFALTCTR